MPELVSKNLPLQVYAAAFGIQCVSVITRLSKIHKHRYEENPHATRQESLHGAGSVLRCQEPAESEVRSVDIRL